MRSAKLALIVTGVISFGCQKTEVNTVELVMPVLELGVDRRTDGRYEYTALAGFGCANQQDDDENEQPRPAFLFARAFSVASAAAQEATVALTIVVDTIRMGGYPRCRASEIYSFCSEPDRTCAPLESERRCFDLEPLQIPINNRRRLTEQADEIFVSYVQERLQGRLVASAAVDEEAMIRVVGTTQTCAEIEAGGNMRFDMTKLLGCSYSCPLVPAAARGEILLDLDAQVFCEPAVRACASDTFALAETGRLDTDPMGELPVRPARDSRSDR